MPAVTDRSAEAPGRSRAWGWVAHLEGGGTTSWATWRRRAGTEAPAAGPWLPGAQQLELLRRLNQAGRPSPELARRVLTAPAVGRGRHDVGLVGVEPEGRFGPQPLDPADLDDDELLRVAVGLLAASLADPSAESPRLPDVRGQTNRLARWRRARYRIAGDPELAAPWRAALRADRRPPGGPGALTLVLGTDLATMLGHAWTTGAFAEGGPTWPDFLEVWRARGGVPRRIDLPAIADHWRDHPSVGRVEVVLEGASVPRLLGLRPARRWRIGTRPVPHAAAELARRTADALGSTVTVEDRATLLTERLRPRLELVSGAAPAVPGEHRAWVEARASRMRDRLLRAGHHLQGDPDLLLPRWSSPGAAPEPGPLEIALVLLLGGLTSDRAAGGRA